MESKLQLAGAILLPNVGAYINSSVTRQHLKPWYESLKKPSFNPPNWVFAPVWTSIYTGMGYASYLVYRDGGGFNAATKTALSLYGAQMALNMAWTPLFFHYHSFKWSLVDIIALTGMSVGCGIAFHKINPLAGYLFIPYVAWLSFASLLNYKYFALNKESGSNDTESMGSITEIVDQKKEK